MSNTNDIENLFRDKLSDFDLQSQPQGWDKVESTLNKNRGNFYKKIATASIVASVIIAGALLYVLNNDEAKTVIVNNETNQQIITEEVFITEEKKSEPIITENKTQFEKISCNETKQEKVNAIKTNTLDTNTIEVAEKTLVEGIKEIEELILPSASFKLQATQGCLPFTTEFIPGEISDTMIYMWSFGDGVTSNEKNPLHIYTKAGEYNVSLTVKYYRTSHIICETKETAITVYPKPKSDFNYTQELSDFTFVNTSSDYENCIWLGFENQILTNTKVDYQFTKSGDYRISLISINDFGCSDTIIKTITYLEKNTFEIYMPNAFTPDNDGVNDIFGINKTIEVNSFYMQIFDLQGKMLYESFESTKGWNGKDKRGQLAPNGKYIWKIILTDKTNTRYKKSGYLNLIR